MTTIKCDFRDIVDEAAIGTVYFAATETRAAYSKPGVTTTSRRVGIALKGGRATSPELDPGRTRIELEAAEGVYREWVVNLPAEGEVTLAELEDMTAEYQPAVVTRVMLAEKQTRDNAQRAEKAAATIPAFEDAVVKVTSASTVVEEATRRAEAAAGDSEMHAEEASASQVASESARDESRLARDTGTAARDEVTSLAVSIKADRSAAEEAARNAEATAKREAAAAVAALVDSAPEHLDTLAEIAQLLTKQGDAASALTQTVAGKAPLKHTHQVGDISGLQATLSGKAEASHQHSISQVDELQATLDGIRDELAKRARGNFDFTVATKPPGPGTPATTVTVITEVLP